MPFGLNEGHTMGFTVDLGVLNYTQTIGGDTLNWTTVRQSIIDGVPRTAGVESRRSVTFGGPITGPLGVSYDVNLSIPNRWYLVSNGGDGGSVLDYLHFHGLQDLKPEKTFDLTQTTYEITCLDIHFCCYKRIDEAIMLFKDYNLDITTGTGTGLSGTSVILDFYFTGFTGSTDLWYKGEKSNNTYKLLAFDKFIEYIDYLRFIIYKAYTRTVIASAVKTYTNHFLNHFTFFKQTASQDGGTGASLSTANMYFIAYATVAGGGELDVKSDISLIGEFETAWDIYSAATDGYACKGVVRYDISELTTDRHVITWHKVYSPVTSLRTILLSDIVKEGCEMTTGKNIPSLISTNVRVPDGDVNQYKQKYVGLSSEHNDEMTIIWHTNVTAAGCETIEYVDGKHYTQKQDDYLDNSRKLFYFDTNKWLRVHDSHRVDLGSYDGVETNYVSNTDYGTVGFPPSSGTLDDVYYEYPNISNTTLTQYINEFRYKLIGLPRLCAVAKGTALNRSEVAYIKFTNPFRFKNKVSGDNVFTLDEIGEMVDFPLDTISFLNPPYSNKGQVVRVRTDWIKMTSEVTLWMRGF